MMSARRLHPFPLADLPAAESVEQAREWMLQTIRRLPAEEVPLTAAAGRVLATDVTAPADLWPFPRSAMDGFAVRAADIAQASAQRPEVLRLPDVGPAGGPSGPAVTAGTTLRVATGAPLPEGADAVIPFEDVEEAEGWLTVRGPVPPGKHVFPAAEDARRGDLLLPAGTVLRGGNLGLLAALGLTTVAVTRRARVALLAVGDELVDAAVTPRPGQVRETNSYTLGAEIAALGGEVRRLGIARDDAAALTACIREGLSADALIVCGGMSVGERDLVKEALVAADVRLLFWRVAMKPGYPAAFGLAGEVPVFGLPGTPGAAMGAFEELVRPALRAMMGVRRIDDAWLPAALGAAISVKPGRRRYLWARATAGAGGLVAHPLPNQSTATLRSQSDANAIIRLGAEVARLAAGDRVEIRLRGELAAITQVAPSVPVLAVVGAKDAGKTTLIEHLVPEFNRRGYRVGVIKHDVHGFAIDHEGTDTYRAAAAGAEAVAIAGPGQVAVIIRAAGEMPLAEVKARLGEVDLILLEGYSQEPVPKVEVRRDGVRGGKPAPAGPFLAVVAAPGAGGSAVTFPDITELLERIVQELYLRPRR